MKRVLRVLLVVLAVLAGLFVLFAIALSLAEYSPKDVEDVEVFGEASGKIETGKDITIVSWNIGYGGLGKESDFVIDGGAALKNNPSKADVQTYLEGISSTLESLDADIYLFQEVDANSTRSHHIDEREILNSGVGDFAENYKCLFVPYPIPPVGMVVSGLYTTTEFEVESAQRLSLTVPFKWPWRVANLKRCLLVNYLPVEGSDKKLVLVNLHLEAYDDGVGRKAQAEELYSFLESEYQKGNYVIAGGDFNHVFPTSDEIYPIHTGTWIPDFVKDEDLPHGFRLCYDLETPSCRLLNQPYDPSDEENTQYYVIDGFIVSNNVQVNKVHTEDLAFEDSDHNPVSISVVLRPENGR